MMVERFSRKRMLKEYTLTYILNGLSENGEFDVTRDPFDQLPSRGVAPNVRIYSMIIGSLTYIQQGDGESWLCIQ